MLPLCRACDDKGCKQVKIHDKRTKRKSKRAAAGEKKAATAAAHASLATAPITSGGTALSADSDSQLGSDNFGEGESEHSGEAVCGGRKRQRADGASRQHLRRGCQQHRS